MASGHFHPARWHLVEHRHVEVPVQRHGQGAWGGGGGHDQEVRVVVLCLFPKLNPLVHAETVLFVNDRDAEPGEIQVRGPAVFAEYWQRPDVTTKSFDDGWFRTGAIAVCEDGYYRIMGRRSVDIIKSGGYKLSALEIEAALLEHPAIRECAVVGVSDDTWGEVVAATVVLSDDEELDLESLRAWCRDRLSKYKIPQRLLVVDSLPRNAMGKVTKPDVAKMF